MGTLCPSSHCRKGAILLGIVVDDKVAFTTHRMVVDAAFVQSATENGGHPPESRFRFSAPCVKGACSQWSGSRCGVIDGVLGEAALQGYAVRADEALPNCAIRDACRWWKQAGREACGVCDLVITDSRNSPP
jgi:hypothetical protein